MQYCWLSFILIGFMPVESFSFLQELKISLNYVSRHSAGRKHQEIQRIKKITGYYKNWLLCSIWNIWWYHSGSNNLFIIFCWQITETKITQSFKPIRVPKLNFVIQNGKFFQVLSTSRNKTQVRTFEKTIGPYLLDPCEKPDPMLLLNAKSS